MRSSSYEANDAASSWRWGRAWAPLVLFGAIQLGLLVRFHATTTIDFSDSFEILRNAQSIAGVGAGGWYPSRAVGLPLALAPWVRLGPAAGYAGAHAVALGFALASVAATYLLARRVAGPAAAALAAALLAGNEIWILNAGMVKEDIPAAALLAGGAAMLAGADAARARAARVGAILLGGAMAMRFNVIPLAFFLVGAFLYLRRRSAAASADLLLFSIPPAVYALLVAIAFPAAGVASLADTPATYLAHVREQFGRNQAAHRSVGVYVFALAQSATIPVLALAFAGALRGLARAERTITVLTASVLLFFAIHGVALGQKEVRYLVPILPFLYALLAAGLDAVAPAFSRHRALAGAFAVALFLLPGIRTIEAWRRLADPVYRADVPRRLARNAFAAAGDAPVSWVGTYYPLAPRDRVVFLGDPYTCMYHLREHVVAYFAQRPVGLRRVDRFARTGEPVFPVFAGAPVVDGEIWIVNRAPESYESWTMPDRLPPLLLQRATVTQGRRIDSASLPATFRLGAGRIALRHGADAGAVGEGIAPGTYQLQFLLGEVASLSDEVLVVSDGSFRLPLRKSPADPFPERVDLVSYRVIDRF